MHILCRHPRTGEERSFLYDNQTSALTHLDGSSVVEVKTKTWRRAPVTSRTGPLQGKHHVRVVKIQLGLMCNYACSYCSQRFVPRADQTGPKDVDLFMSSMPSWFAGGEKGDGSGCKVQFWGGEPFVYWKTLKPLAEAIRARWPQIKLGIVTNGSLLSLEKNAWLDELGFSVGVSHDGPGQHVRGPDPLEDPAQRAAILDLFRRLGPNRMSINAMLHKGNASRQAIAEHLQGIFGETLHIGEGGFIDAYDEGGLASAVPDAEWGRSYAGNALSELRAGKTLAFRIAHSRTAKFIESILHGRPASNIGQKCGMDRQDTLAVDLRGNVLTCQNLSADATAPNGESHRIGHVDELSAVSLKTSTHWSLRDGCPKCPMLHICSGSCMFLEGERWEASCRSAYFDAVPFFAAGIEYLTGFIPYRIEADIPDERKELFSQKPLRKIIPLKVAA